MTTSFAFINPWEIYYGWTLCKGSRLWLHAKEQCIRRNVPTGTYTHQVFMEDLNEIENILKVYVLPAKPDP